ncbi:MAG TPA: phosphatidylinositol-specific phospholipase C/glycerophosphodiester phosphodiesterase family protein [Opitutaceae bacterium]|nr:phosphatidylinositol-specific phospholipase C/glycerophosphodiester phosphodiesterase family protein [Opitutaceae bacterium]
MGILCLASSFVAWAETPQRPVAHAHNDYEHARPLSEALEKKFGSVEADIYLVKGALLVAHDLEDVRPERTLQSLYLDPLAARVRANQGWVEEPGQTLILLVDVKSEAEATFLALHRVLSSYAEILTSVERDRRTVRAVTVVVSGNRSLALTAAQDPRYAALDGRLPDLEGDVNADLMPMISANWRSQFTWRGEGPMPASELKTLHEWVAKAGAQKKQLRFWATPDLPVVWKQLRASGVHIIGTDDLTGLSRFLAEPSGLKDFRTGAF